MTVIDSPNVTPGREKWDFFSALRDAWSNPLTLARAVTPLAMSRWILYQTSEHRFPLPDSPIMVNRSSVMAVLSPRLLLEINLNVVRDEDQWLVRKGISSSKYREFCRRAIANTFKEVIHSDRDVLTMWRCTPEYRRRVSAINDRAEARLLIGQAVTRVLWMIGGMGRVPDTFEDFARPYFEGDLGV